MSRSMRKYLAINLCLVSLEEGEANYVPTSPVKEGKEWLALMLRLTIALNTKGAPPTPTAISRSRLDLSEISYSVVCENGDRAQEMSDFQNRCSKVKHNVFREDSDYEKRERQAKRELGSIHLPPCTGNLIPVSKYCGPTCVCK
ncbi:hypothetical protein J6590_095409 [Homalodisca vitripennis]|nr:hypothetical protein J6590_095409 [Homalodisca vitripennis]